MMANGKEGMSEMSAVECAQHMYDMLKEKGFDEEVLNNAHQLVKKIQDKSKELSNVKHMDEETPEEDATEDMDEEQEEDMPDYENMSEDDMRKDLGKKGIIQITIGKK